MRDHRSPVAGGPEGGSLDGERDDPAELARLRAPLNPPGLVVTTSQRVILHRHLAAHGLATPPLHGVVGRAGGWSASSGGPVLDARAIAALFAGLPEAFMIVPSGAAAADALRVLRRDGSALVGPEGARTQMDAFAVEILADPAHELFIVMGLPEVHEVVRTLMPAAPVPAARITTLVSDEGEVEVVHAFLRSLPDSASDGAHRIEPADGALAGEKALGRLPHWSAAADLVRRAATLLLPQRTISWDVALTPNGPLVIDAVSDYAWVPGVGFDMVLARLRAGATPAGVAP